MKTTLLITSLWKKSNSNLYLIFYLAKFFNINKIAYDNKRNLILDLRIVEEPSSIGGKAFSYKVRNP